MVHRQPGTATRSAGTAVLYYAGTRGPQLSRDRLEITTIHGTACRCFLPPVARSGVSWTDALAVDSCELSQHVIK